MLKSSVTIFVCLLPHVCRICDYLPAPVQKSAFRTHDKYRKTLLQALSKLFLWRSKVKTEASYPVGKKIIERWRTPFNQRRTGCLCFSCRGAGGGA